MQNNATKYTKNPITEALCMVTFKPHDFDVTMAVELGNNLPEYDGKFSTKADVQGSLGLPGTSGPQFNFSATINRAHLKSSDGYKIVTVGSDRFGVHRVEKYESWDDELRPRAQQALREYFKLQSMDKMSINTAIVRYINQIVIPKSLGGLEPYLKIGITNISGQEPVTVTRLAHSTQFSLQEEIFLNLNIQYGTGFVSKEQEQDNLCLMLDFEVVQVINSECAVEEIITVFDELKSHQRSAFENIITDQYRELIQ